VGGVEDNWGTGTVNRRSEKANLAAPAQRQGNEKEHQRSCPAMLVKPKEKGEENKRHFGVQKKGGGLCSREGKT